MRTATKVDKVRTQRVLRKDLVGFFGDEFALHPGRFVLLKPFFFPGHHAFVLQVAVADLFHTLLNLFQIFCRKRRFALKVVEESGLSRRTNPQLSFRKQFKDSGGAQMRGGVPVDDKCFRIARRQNLKCRIGSEGSGEVCQFPVHTGDQGIVGKARTDRPGDLHRRAGGRNGLHAAIRQRHVDVAHLL